MANKNLDSFGNNKANKGKNTQNNKNVQGNRNSQTGRGGQNNKNGQNSKNGHKNNQSAKSNQPGKNNQQKGKNNNPNRTSQEYSRKEKTIEEKVTPVTPDEADDIRVTIDLDDGTSVECSILTIMTVDDQDYIALLPMDENDQPNAENVVFLYRYFEDAKGIPFLENIESDEEYENVFDAFDEWQDEELFDSMPD